MSLMSPTLMLQLRELVSSWYRNFHCSTHQLQDIAWQIKLRAITRNVNKLIWAEAIRQVNHGSECTYWNTRLGINCSVEASMTGTHREERFDQATLDTIRGLLKRAYRPACRGNYAIC